MDIKSLNEFIPSGKRSTDDNSIVLFDLFVSAFIYDPTVELREYVVGAEDEMRIDLIFQKIYEFEPNEVGVYLGDVDVILFINGISNALNIRKGSVIKYPSYGDINKFRVSDISSDMNKTETVKNRLSYLNKSTRKDKSRGKFVSDGYSLPPVVLDSPRDAVVIKDGKFSIGGL